MTLETPPLIFFNGEVVPWEMGKVHVWSETAIRATNVFEGLRAYWSEETQCWRLVSWSDHMNRLDQSARLLRIPHSFTHSYFLSGVRELLNALPYRQDMYVRPTIFVEHGPFAHRPEDMIIGSYVVSFPVPRFDTRPRPLRCLVSSWPRVDDLAGMPRAKSGAIYHNIRLPRIEANDRGFDDAILINRHGQVAELTGACLFIVRSGKVATPRVTDGILEGITRRTVLQIVRDQMGTTIEERAVDRSELYVADELFSAGTLSEICSIQVVDDLRVGKGEVGDITLKVSRVYDDVCTGNDPAYGLSIALNAI